MAPAAKKQRALVDPATLPGQLGIASYAKVSKPLAPSIEVSSKKAAVSEKSVAETVKTATTDGKTQKRKHDDAVAEPIVFKQPKLDPKLAATSALPGRKIAQLKGTAKSMSSKGPRASSTLAAASSSPDSSPASLFDPAERLASSPVSDYDIGPVAFLVDFKDADVQDHLSDMEELYRALLSALSIHYAHNGSRAPVDFNQLKPSIERIWGKRGIEILDIQRVMGVAISEFVSAHGLETHIINFPCAQPAKAHNPVPVRVAITETEYSSKPAALARYPLSLRDYGHGKVCIELDDAYLDSHSHIHPLNTTTLVGKFKKAIDRYNLNGTPFAKLPLASITPCGSLKHVSAFQNKTRAHIADLKAGAIRAQANNDRKAQGKLMAPPETPLTMLATISPSDPSARSNSLIARILAKQNIAANKPAPPSTETLARKAAFQRLDEIVSVLDCLVAVQMRKPLKIPGAFHKKPRGDQTYSFTIPMLVQYLQGSMRNPISKDDVVKCMGLLAEKGIGKGYVGLKDVVSGGIKLKGDVGKVVIVKGGVGSLRGRMIDDSMSS